MSYEFDIDTIRRILGGTWPDVPGYYGFSYEAVDHYKLEDGLLIPYDGFGTPCPGPSFKLTPIPDPFATVEDPSGAMVQKLDHIGRGGPLGPQRMLFVDGSETSFRCTGGCRCNIFTEIGPLKYRCNACGSIYQGYNP